MKNKFLKIVVIALCVGMVTSCNKMLDLQPTNSFTSGTVFNSLATTKQALAKVYAAWGLTGNSGNGSSDLSGYDPNFSDFLRSFYYLQELPTEESICAWNDAGVPDFHNLSWVPTNNQFIEGMYNRSIYQIDVANAFLRQTAADTVENANFSAADADSVKVFRAEARFIRAYQYWVLMDLYGNPPFTDENSEVGSVNPQQIKRADLFKYVESELLAIQNELKPAGQNEYARADQGADWALLARLYLNAEVYTGTQRYTDAITYASKVINSGVYDLKSNYNELFLADNNVNNPEQILSIAYDGIKGPTNGGTTFLMQCSYNSDMEADVNYGFNGGNLAWGGMRATSTLPKLFGDDYTKSSDSRARLFYGSTYDIADPKNFKQGIAVTKWRNVKSDGTIPAGTVDIASTDFPLFRLAEQYLIYAEAVLRGGTGGDMTTAISYFNKIRKRAYGNESGNVSSINLNLILDERAREFYWECMRRTDLIRFGKFTSSSYVWPWKGGAADGTGVSDKYNLYPIPVSDIQANPNLTQNTGY
ncbi:hypothetical protein A9P82_11440 [Arachidicoccus ginsenosidimutans]|uniref:RagB/SusD family nutrient uptake outer membrane protein n=1 Tax=Arachidicoccus sp. BS20 TaxID=1850526 RepID=UPI0007F06902|nr:RagB/SusD family nutrient uptake outer membrane protein [Arachidicoccus sp. BS20]ANI89846.1 hypothetical protein A9P82_11440 [Arachidicoccus sp. BS20]